MTETRPCGAVPRLSRRNGLLLHNSGPSPRYRFTALALVNSEFEKNIVDVLPDGCQDRSCLWLGRFPSPGLL